MCLSCHDATADYLPGSTGPNIIKIYDIFACLITTCWLSRSSPEAAGELLTLSGGLHAAAGELRDNKDIVIRHANMS